MMQLLHRGAVATMKVVTLDFERNTGGKRITLQQAQITGSNHSTKKNGTVTLREHHRYQEPITVHVALIEEFNGRPVL